MVLKGIFVPSVTKGEGDFFKKKSLPLHRGTPSPFKNLSMANLHLTDFVSEQLWGCCVCSPMFYGITFMLQKIGNFLYKERELLIMKIFFLQI